MRDYAERLDRRLRVIAVDLPGRPPLLSLVPPPGELHRATRPRRGRAHRRSLWTGGAAALAAAAATTVVIGGSSAAGLPILQTETSDASAASTKRLQMAGVDVRQGHAFDTPDGPGWVIASADGQRICIALPDRDSPGGYPTTCGPLARVERDGMALESVGDKTEDPTATNLVGLVLPLGAEDVQLRTNGRTGPASVEAGVAVAALAGPGTFTYRLDDRLHRRSFQGPFVTTKYWCDDTPSPGRAKGKPLRRTWTAC